MVIYYKDGRWNLNPYLVKYNQHGENLEKYTEDKEWWLDFEEKWDHTEVLEFVDVEYTTEQKERFKQIEHLPEDFGKTYSDYVKDGSFNDDMPSQHPFNLIRMKYEQSSRDNYMLEIDMLMTMKELGL